MTEKSLYQILKRRVPEVFYTRIENAAGVGAFDCTCAYLSNNFWLEFKIYRTKKVPHNFGLRTSQVLWAKQMLAHGVKNMFILAMDESKGLLSAIKLLGHDGKEFIVVGECMDIKHKNMPSWLKTFINISLL